VVDAGERRDEKEDATDELELGSWHFVVSSLAKQLFFLLEKI
jgi:hypothetical protein